MNLKQKAILTSVALALTIGFGNASAAVKDRKMKFSYAVSESNPVGKAVNKFIEVANEKSAGKFKITGYADAKLGSEIQSMSSAQGGTIELSVVSTAGAASNVKELGVFDLPFIFQSVEESDAVLDGPVGKELLAKFADSNLIGMCYWDYGFRQVTNSKHAINKLEDFSDLKLRVLQNKIYIDTFKALGANPLPLPYPETFTALESKAIDGQESSFLVTKSSGYQEIQKHLTETKHVFLPAVVMVSKRYWDKLDAEEQNILQESCDESVTYFREVSRQMEKDVVEELIQAGLEFNTIEPAEKARIVEAVAGVTAKYKEELGADIVDAVLSTIEEVRNSK